ncbi:virion capsid protein-91 [Alphabaculovirus altersperidaniae]|uniref:Virion capsid protein-91 n=1 Tax=Spodoptera eridania nucleopolyhedrovirus TaxID=2315721 RepID=A0ABX6TQY1_9ABAC|nr:virion capsid protein-91 [Spodoptera eridania nucleopolyhedrovirus]QNV47885.1 virion capsid protein-91 [Spodoptera eridania nucleopolyhedrovirus]
MSMVPLLLVAIILILLFSIFYLIIYSEYNEQDFDNKLRVVTEYAKRTNAEHPLPDSIRYVSEVNANFYVLRTIDTGSLNEINTRWYDDRVETFNFIEQNLEKNDLSSIRVRAVDSDRTKYEVRGDDGWMRVDCPSEERFDATSMKCVPIPPCDGKTPGMYGLTERLIDSLVLHHRVPRATDSADSNIHPTMYMRCLEGGSHVVEECPNNHLFNGSECELRNDCVNRPDGFVLNVFPEHLNINEYMICENGTNKIVSCPFGKIFDRRLLVCVDADPCSVHGADYTYITDDIGPTQFYKCLSNTAAELVTCINRVFVNDRYECSGDVRCSVFPMGTGTNLLTYTDDVVSFNYGVLICDNYNIVTDKMCDMTNRVDHLYNDKFILNIHIPREIYNSNTSQCEPAVMSNMSFSKLGYAIENIPNDLEVEFSTAFVGYTQDIFKIVDSDRLDGAVMYVRDSDRLGINPIDQMFIDCFEDYLYDPFEGTKLNVCKDDELKESIEFTPDQYLVPTKMEIHSDADYEHYCSRRLTSNFVEFDHFTTQIMANILRSDACGELLTKIHDKYTTISLKYTTIRDKYNYESVKGAEYIERYRANIQNFINIQNVDLDENTLHDDDDILNPIFDVFEKYDVIEPLFDPWSSRDIMDCHPDDIFCDGGMGGGGGGILPPPPPPPPPIPEEPEPPTLTLTDKQLSYTCFYAVPTFKLSACNVVDDHIKETIRTLRDNISVDELCESASGLANIINAYAYLGDGLGCKSSFDGQTIKVQAVDDGKVFLNLDTQSNDGVQYNKWIYNYNGSIMACPDHAITDDFTCNLEEDRIYFIQDLQN